MRKKNPLYTVSIDELPFEERIIAVMLRAYLSRQTNPLSILTPIIREGVAIKFPTPPSAAELLQVEKCDEDEEVRIVKQVKNSLNSKGADLMFEIRPNTGFQWLGVAERTETQSLSEITLETIPKTKHELAAFLIKKALANGAVESMEIKRIMAEYRIGDKTMNEVKTELGIKPYKKMRTWYWVLPGENTDKQKDD